MMRKVFGIALVALALGIGILPQYTTCQHQGKGLALANGRTVPMKCNWTAQAEIAVAIPIAAVGAMSIFSRRRESMRNLAVMGAVLGVLALLLPTNLIGVCQSSMLCNTVMKPSLIVFGSLVIGGSLGIILWTRKVGD